jgi:hypothetical protein
MTLTTLDRDTKAGAEAVAVTERPLYRTIEDFVAHVIYDGRFIDRFTTETEHVAELLQVRLTPEVIEALRGRDRTQILAQTTEKMTRDYGEQKKVEAPAPEGAYIVVVIVVTIVCVFIPFKPVRTVEDTSPNADLKL